MPISELHFHASIKLIQYNTTYLLIWSFFFMHANFRIALSRLNKDFFQQSFHFSEVHFHASAAQMQWYCRALWAMDLLKPCVAVRAGSNLRPYGRTAPNRLLSHHAPQKKQPHSTNLNKDFCQQSCFHFKLLCAHSKLRFRL